MRRGIFVGTLFLLFAGLTLGPAYAGYYEDSGWSWINDSGANPEIGVGGHSYVNGATARAIAQVSVGSYAEYAKGFAQAKGSNVISWHAVPDEEGDPPPLRNLTVTDPGTDTVNLFTNLWAIAQTWAKVTVQVGPDGGPSQSWEHEPDDNNGHKCEGTSNPPAKQHSFSPLATGTIQGTKTVYVWHRAVAEALYAYDPDQLSSGEADQTTTGQPSWNTNPLP